EVRKLAQKWATASADKGTMTRLGVRTRMRLSAGRGLPGAQRQRAPIARLKAVQEWCLRVREGELKGTLGDSHAAIDAGRGWWRLLIHLEADVIEQGRFGEDLVSQCSGMVDLGPPAQKVEQIVGVTAQSGFRNPAHTLLIQKTVAPFHL